MRRKIAMGILISWIVIISICCIPKKTVKKEVMIKQGNTQEQRIEIDVYIKGFEVAKGIGSYIYDEIIAYNRYQVAQEETEILKERKLEVEIQILEEKEEQMKQALAKQQKQPKNDYSDYYTTGGLTKRGGVNVNENGNKETYYNLDMGGVCNNAQNNGVQGGYWVREDGVKMWGNYVIVAANQSVYPYGTIVQTSLGEGIVLDTGDFAEDNPQQFDIATAW